MYAVFRDPMYTVMILLTLPGLFLLCNSWLVLAGVIPAYVFTGYSYARSTDTSRACTARSTGNT